jgi:hypothetical protein
MPVSLADWESFYVITGTAGAALTGLTFIVITLAGDRAERASADGVGAFSTPAVTHFSIALVAPVPSPVSATGSRSASSEQS